jgi:hypothetical protein
MMITKQRKIRTDKKAKQSKAADSLLVGSAESVTKTATLSAQPISSAEFLHELEAQRTASRRCDNVKGLTEMILAAAKPAPAVETPAKATDSPRAHEVIKLGIEVHLDRYVVVRQIDGGAPQPPQRFSPAQFLEWAKKQTELAKHVYSC